MYVLKCLLNILQIVKRTENSILWTDLVSVRFRYWTYSFEMNVTISGVYVYYRLISGMSHIGNLLHQIYIYIYSGWNSIYNQEYIRWKKVNFCNTLFQSKNFEIKNIEHSTYVCFQISLVQLGRSMKFDIHIIRRI